MISVALSWAWPGSSFTKHKVHSIAFSEENFRSRWHLAIRDGWKAEREWFGSDHLGNAEDSKPDKFSLKPCPKPEKYNRIEHHALSNGQVSMQTLSPQAGSCDWCTRSFSLSEHPSNHPPSLLMCSASPSGHGAIVGKTLALLAIFLAKYAKIWSRW